MWVLGKWFSQETTSRIQAAADSGPGVTRSELARQVCEWLGWAGTNGKASEASARKALRTLERRGVVRLPAAVPVAAFRVSMKAKGAPSGDEWPERVPVVCELAELAGLEVVPVGEGDRKASDEWDELLERDHYLGTGPLCGGRLRYLVRSGSHGVLGALAFSGASKRLKARDEWIGWSERARQAHLKQVVCNSRFLIAAHVRVPNLASKVLSMALDRLPGDWKRRYGDEPVLVETFVDGGRFEGTCYKAANFERLGTSAGRRDPFENGKRSSGSKELLVRPLVSDCRDILRREPRRALEFRGAGTTAVDWADHEFGGAQVFDARLGRRLADMARDFFRRPGASIPTIFDGSQAKMKGAYRLIGNERLDMQGLLSGHLDASLGRCREHRVVLAVQDTTTLNYASHPDTEGLGPINTKKDKGTGLVLHSTIAFALDGTPLGVLDAQCWARDPAEAGKATRRKELPIEEKESSKWLKSYRATADAQRACPETTFVNTGDREADIHELFLEAAKDPAGPKLLIRAMQGRNRRVAAEPGKSLSKDDECEDLWERIQRQEPAGTVRIHVPRKPGQKEREATLEIRFSRLTLAPPKRRPELNSVEIWGVHAREIRQPQDGEPIEWLLFTTMGVTNLTQAVERVQWYSLRWGIEVFHRNLKSGVGVEERQLGDADAIRNCLAIDMVVAWRIHYLIKLGRETPDLPCTVIFSEDEWKVLCLAVRRQSPPALPPSLRDAIRMTAKFGGFLGRKGDGEPGALSLWKGLVRLDGMVIGYRIAMDERARAGP